MTVRSPEVRIFLVGVGGVGVKVFHFHLCVILLTLIGDSNKKLSRCSTTNTVTLAFRPVKKKENGEPRQKAAFCRPEGRPVRATATKNCRRLRRPRQLQMRRKRANFVAEVREGGPGYGEG